MYGHDIPASNEAHHKLRVAQLARQQRLVAHLTGDTMSKFDSKLDEYVYAVSLDGMCDDEIGSSSEGPAWYGLMIHGHTIFQDHDPCLETLCDSDQVKLTDCAGVIIRESTDGFVYVTYYDTQKELESEWERLEYDMQHAEVANRQN